MSYRRKFSKQFDVPISVSISSPSAHATQDGHLSTSHGHVTVYVDGRPHSFSIGVNGGGGSHDLSYVDVVDVDIEVDTVPFDGSIASCNKHVQALTGSVAATETAQVASVEENSKKIAHTIITGFFKNVQADISSRMLELSQKVEARLIHLHEQSKTLLAKRTQMENDYQRTKARYIKVIQDLDKELENRVKALDEPIFKMVSVVEGESRRAVSTDFAEIASIVAKENMALAAQINMAMTKKRAKHAISRAVDFLRIQKQTDNAIQQSTISGVPADNGSYYLPVFFFELKDAKGIARHDVTYDKDHLPSSVDSKIEDAVFSNPNHKFSMHDIERDNVEKFFSAEIQEAMLSTKDAHGIRVINTISKLFFE